MRPSVPTSHPAFGVAKATAQKPLTPGNVNQVFPSSGVQAAAPVENVGGSLAVITTARPSCFRRRDQSFRHNSTENRAGYRRRIRESPCLPPSLEIAVRALLGLPGSKSPPPTIPWCGSRKSTVNAPPMGPLNNGVSYAFQVFPLIRGSQYPGNRRDACRNPRVPATLCCDASAA